MGILVFILGVVFGAVLCYLKFGVEKAVAVAKAEEADRARLRMTETFQAISGESLKSNNRAFLELAKESLQSVLKEAKGETDKKEEAIKNLVKPLEESLKRYEEQINELEKSRSEAYGNLEGQVRNLIECQKLLQKETSNLVGALRRPEVRGRWGEIALRRVVELAGMTAHCDFSEQVSVPTDDGTLRPDMIVRLPAGREIVIDSKISLDAYLDAVSAASDDDKKNFLAKHAQQVRKHMKSLSGKSYWEQFEKAPEYAVMFMPGDSFLHAAAQEDPTLIEEALASRVLIATPTTLIALLKAVAYGWKQEAIGRNAAEIASIGRELYERFQPFLAHVDRTGSSLAQAVNSFNSMISSLEKRVLVSVKKFQELGASSDKELPDIDKIEQMPVKLQDRE